MANEVRLNQAVPNGYTELGIPAMWAFPGGDGRLVKLADAENGWKDHPSLAGKTIKRAAGALSREADSKHGTKVLTLVAANSQNLSGVAYGTQKITLCSPIYVDDEGDTRVFAPRAIWLAFEMLSPGDVLLIEIAAPKPNKDLPLELDETIGNTSVKNQIEIAIKQKGIVVIMCAGNGDTNIVSPTSAICVGACTRELKKHATSNFGAVDCCSFGDGVDCGGKFGQSTFVDSLSETSAAGAIVAGMVLGMQSARKAAFKDPLDHNEVRQLIPQCGTHAIDGLGVLLNAGELTRRALSMP